jgi:Spy/CpxP family protein refolding chaperone
LIILSSEVKKATLRILKHPRKEVISMKKTIIIGLCLALGLALMAAVALAWGPSFGRGFGPGPGGFAGPAVQAWGPGFGPGFGRGFGPAYGVPPIPNLTAEQSSKIQTLRDSFLKEIEPLQKDFYTKGTELRNLWSTPKADPAAITAKQKEIFDLQSKLQEKATNLGLEIRKVLTPEQLAQLPAFSQGTGFGPGAGFGPGMGFGPRMGMRGPMGRW